MKFQKVTECDVCNEEKYCHELHNNWKNKPIRFNICFTCFQFLVVDFIKFNTKEL
jgi:hypothetical protein